MGMYEYKWTFIYGTKKKKTENVKIQFYLSIFFFFFFCIIAKRKVKSCSILAQIMFKLRIFKINSMKSDGI